MKIEGDRIIFDTGKSKYATRGILGLTPKLDVTEGWDGGFFNWDGIERDSPFFDEDETLTQAELADLGLFMIRQWRKFLRKALQKETISYKGP